MARGIAHSAETRAAVIAAFLAGESLQDVSATFHISKSTASAWREAARLNGTEVVRTQKGPELGELVAAIVETNLVTLKAQADHFRDKTWLTRQSAAELAVLYGVTFDKTFRIISSLEPVREGSI
jgi:transposase